MIFYHWVFVLSKFILYKVTQASNLKSAQPTNKPKLKQILHLHNISLDIYVKVIKLSANILKLKNLFFFFNVKKYLRPGVAQRHKM